MFVPSDFNGDGKCDIAYIFNDHHGITADVKIATGRLFKTERWATRQGDWVGDDDWSHHAAFLPSDFNGDGKADFAYIYNANGFVTIDVHSSSGQTTIPDGNGFTLQRWTQAPNPWRGADAWQGSATFLAGGFDGSGKSLIAYIYNDDGAQSFDVYAADPKAPDLLNIVQNGLGGSIFVEYESAGRLSETIQPGTPGPGIPNLRPRQAVTRVTTQDGRGGAFSVRYNYSDGRIVSGPVANQRDLGWRQVDAIEEQTGQLQRKLYNQSPGFEHLVAEEKEFAADGTLMRSIAHFHDLIFPSAGTELAVETMQVETDFEFGLRGFSRATTFSYDLCGNISRRLNEGEGIDPIAFTTSFSCDQSSWALDRILETKTIDPITGQVLNWMRNAWSGDVIASKSEWLDISNTWLTTLLSYDAGGALIGTTEPMTEDGLTRFSGRELDPIFRAYPVVLTDALGHDTLIEYNSEGLIASQTDTNGQTSTTTYDVFGRMASQTRPDGGVTTFRYVNYGDPNSQANVTVATVGMSTLETAEFFDGVGFKYRTWTSGDSGSRICTETQKDPAGRTAAISVAHFCDAADIAPFAVTTFDAAGRTSTVTSPDGRTTFYSYAGNYTRVTDPSGASTTTYHNAIGKTIQSVDAIGNTTTYAYDVLSRLISINLSDGHRVTNTFDSLGRRTSTTDSSFGETTIAYDAVGNVLRATSGSKVVRYSYDALNRLLSKQADGEEPVTYTYDESTATNGVGHPTTIVDGGGITRLSYGAMGELTGSVKTIDGVDYAQYFSYDSANRVREIIYPDGSRAEYAYAGGRYLSSVSLNGVEFANWSNYSALGGPAKVVFGNGVETSYVYDVLGRLRALRTTQGNTVLQDLSYSFASDGRDISAISDGRDSKVTSDDTDTDETQAFTYDALHRLTGAVGTWGAKTFTYDVNGDITTFGGIRSRNLAYSNGQLISGTRLGCIKYDDSGNITQKVQDGVLYNYAWSVENRLMSVTRHVGGRPQVAGDFQEGGNSDNDHGRHRGWGWSWSWGQGRRDSSYKRPAPPSADDPNRAAGLDAACLEALATDDTGANGREQEQFERDDGLRGNSRARTTFIYDAAGQRVQKVYENEAEAITTTYLQRMYEKRRSSTGEERRTINLYANNRLLASVTEGGRAFPFQGSLSPFDKELRIASTFSHRSLAGLALRAGHLLGAALYDPNLSLIICLLLASCLLVACAVSTISSSKNTGKRASASALAIIVCVVGCNPREGAEGPGQGGTTVRGLPLGTQFYHLNHVSSSSVVTDALGWEQARYIYLPFGEISLEHSIGQDSATAKFTGQEQDEETGLYYYGARYYDPSLGRFISADSIVANAGDSQSWNRYAYCRNNPIVYTDPTGHFFEEIWNGIKDAASWTYNSTGLKWFVGKIVEGAVWAFNFVKAHPQLVGAVAALTVSFLAPGVGTILVAALLGALAGGLSALANHGSILQGVVVGGVLGAASAALGGAIPVDTGGWAAQIGAGAAQGAIFGAGAGATQGYAGGQGSLGTILKSTLTGAAIGAALGAMKPILFGRVINQDPGVSDQLEKGRQELLNPLDSGVESLSVNTEGVTLRSGGLWNSLYGQSGKLAMTMGRTINIDSRFVFSDGLLSHELVHVYQWDTQGFGYIGGYLLESITQGYNGNSYEKQAYRYGPF